MAVRCFLLLLSRRIQSPLPTAISIERISGDLPTFMHRTPYPVVLKLEQEGHMASDWGASENNRRASFYRITSAERRRQLAAERELEEELAAHVDLLAGE